MSTATYARRIIAELRANREMDKPAPDMTITVSFDRSREDSECLTGFPEFLRIIHEIAPDVPDWEWTESQIQEACRLSKMSRGSIVTGRKYKDVQLYGG